MAKQKKSANKPNVTKISADDDSEKVASVPEVEEEKDENVVEDEGVKDEDVEDEDEEDDDEDDDDEDNDEDDDDDDEDDDDEDEDNDDDEDDEDEDDDDDDDDEDDEIENKKEDGQMTKKEVKTVTAEPVKADLPRQGFFKQLFAKKRDENESILTIFNHRKIYGALLGEVFGTFLITAVVLTLGLYQPLYMFFAVLAVTVGTYKLSGANLNPINTFGMMLSRRISAIRGVLYLLAQVVGAWLGYLMVSGFIVLAAKGGEPAEMPGMTAIADELKVATILIEMMGAVIVGFSFARAQDYKENPLAFGAVVAGGVTIATVVVYLISYSYFGLQGNFMMNPAIALMYQILPTSADGFGELMAGVGQALLTYVLLPMVGGVIGFALSDIAKVFSEEE